MVDETINPLGAHKCLDDSECGGFRTCSEWGWCQGEWACEEIMASLETAEPEPAPEADYPSSNFPELAEENQAFLFSEPDCQGESWAVFPLASGERRDIFYQDWEHLVGHDSHDNVASVQVPEHYILTLWQHDFTGAAETFAGFKVEGLRTWSWGCQNVGTIAD